MEFHGFFHERAWKNKRKDPFVFERYPTDLWLIEETKRYRQSNALSRTRI
jgi:hypothetical protein